MIRIMTSLLAYLWIASVISKAGAECISSNKEAVKLSISTHRNQTGHFISQVAFVHRDAPGVKETDLWRVDVEEKTESCDGIGTSHLTFTISGPAFPAPIRQSTVATTTTVTAKPTVIARPTGYELFPGIGYYKFHDDAAIWPHARAICAEEGAHLVIINSEKESDVTRTLLARFPKFKGASGNNWAWVGIRQVEGVNGQYQTIFGVPLNETGFTRWYPGEPNSNGDYITIARSNGGLNDDPASKELRFGFICEQEL